MELCELGVIDCFMFLGYLEFHLIKESNLMKA